MKHVAEVEGHAETRVRMPTRRALAKQQTRAKVLAAARELFSTQGYEGATIRDIAAAAGMSTGAVFANFADKSELFREIMTSDFDAVLVAMSDAAVRGRTVDDALLKAFSAGYAFYRGQMPLVRAALGLSWSCEDGQALRALPTMQDTIELFAEQLALGVERGELSQECEIKLRSQMLFDNYLANYPQAVFGGWSLEALQARSRDQIRVILAGARRG
ncbi:MAG: helix-turn-helix domain-containing protein [Phenylobacterium sp.]|jgi:AcrR family transcriptional regulator|uniref:TetR/AcrR family transcriptional regulator n=1 Tax=Phenylobacterium sp. TaxID=1871053 RepID=UPI00273666CF|nr:TetR/AcrR family transcriptional regulator [Phenylobacterium sp.]MBW0150825.1 TetR/AcrR family transcriptional regulator [Phenylobacterium sp.]MDP1642577.1 helix-turn-helix domain-containing protein [Phenylobacterium sp.]MDP3115698.1 helix-turn-helix domain-containing protein [Phenylobacterium sp.]MDP3382212.1 helix-turn-helix domain-containing protein [Phenylobacterium sp.]MDZ4054850.1 helix-turn-helix domain-containing protein [Phenylobacterium sp.]